MTLLMLYLLIAMTAWSHMRLAHMMLARIYPEWALETGRYELLLLVGEQRLNNSGERQGDGQQGGDQTG